MRKWPIGSIFIVFMLVISTSIPLIFDRGKPPKPTEATLEQCFELRVVDGVDVPFQHGLPYPSFERQTGRTYKDLAGDWKYKSLGSTNTEITHSLNKRDSTTISQLESKGYHKIDFDDSGWETRTLPVCENDEVIHWFRNNVYVPSSMDGKYVKLVLLGANYVTDVWVNGEYIGWHEGGYTSFFFDVSDYLNYDDYNIIAIRVHNIPWESRNNYEDIVPYRTCDFRNYGGIYRNIYLEATDNLNIVRADIKPSLKLQDGQVVLDEGHIDVNVVVYNHGALTQNANVTLSVWGTNVTDTNILDPAPEAIINSSDQISTTGTVTKSIDVPVSNNVFQDFEPGNGTPGVYFEDVRQTISSFETSRIHGGTRSLKVSTQDQYGGTVAILAANSSGYIDLSSATSISIWVYDTQGNNTVQLRLKDNDGDGGSGDDGNYLWSSMSSVHGQWTKITWYLNDYPDVNSLDLDRIAKIELYESNKGTYYFDDLGYTVQGTKVLTFSLDLSGISLWTPENPTLYVLKINLNDGAENFYTQFGIREVKIDDENCRFLLNRVPTFLAGIARHESMPDVYRKFTEDQMENLKRDFDSAKAANVNFIRTAHYPNHPYLYILADRMGLMMWEEIPTCWFADDAFGVQMRRGVAQQMWLEMIYRDYNRPSIIIWGTTNEADIYEAEPAPGISNRYRFNENLKNIAYMVDGTRLVTQATFWNQDPTWPVDDILGINEYQGVFYYSWAPTLGEFYNQTKAAIRSSHNFHPTKPILVTEMGTWSREDMGRMAEQVRCWNDTYRAFDEKPYIAGVTWWCLNDWWQAPGTAQTMGAITWDRSTKKDVYYEIQTNYENTWTRPWVRILSPFDTESISKTITITARAEDFRGTNISINTVQYRIDSGSYVNMSYQGNDQWSATWDSTAVSDGAHTITVKATDDDGHTRIHLINVVVNNNSKWVQTDWKGGPVPKELSANENTVGLWNFERVRRAKVEDNSGRGNNGRIHDAILTTGRYNMGLRFENAGVDANNAPCAKVSYNENLNFVSGNFTVELWVKPASDYPSSVKGWRYFVRQDNRTGGDWWEACWWIGYDEWWDELAFVVRDSEGGEHKAAYRMSFSTGEWYHIAGVKDGATLKLYINGMLRATGNAPDNYQPSGDLYINYHRANPSDPIFDTFNGVIDEVRIENRALSDSEIAGDGMWAQVGTWSDTYDNYNLGENIDVSSTPGAIKLSKIGNQPPIADFTYSPSLPTIKDGNNTVQFTDTSTDPDGTIVAWLWDFGDGTTSIERNPSHKYLSEGAYTVILTITDDNGATDSIRDEITVSWELVIFQDFEPNNGTQGDYFYDAWNSEPSFDYSIVQGGTRSVRMRAHAGEVGNNGGTIGINVASPSRYVNMQNATIFTVWVYDNQGSNTVELKLRDNTGIFGPGWWSNDHSVGESTGRTVKDQWTKISWDITDYPGVDKSRIISIELYMWWDNYYYFDNAFFTVASGFTVSTSPTLESLAREGFGTATVSIENVGPYDQTVELGYENAPAGVTIDFSQMSGAHDFNSTMTVTVGAETTPGIYPITIKGTGADGKVRTCIYNLAVEETMFQDFEPNNGTPDNYFYEVYYTTRDFESSIVYGGERSLRVQARAEQDGGPNNHGGTVGINVASPSGYVNLDSATTLSIWVYDNVGNNTIELTLKDSNGNTGNYGYSITKSVKQMWTKISWDISSYSGVDKSRIASIELYEWWDGYYYFDNISYIATDGFTGSTSPRSGSFVMSPAPLGNHVKFMGPNTTMGRDTSLTSSTVNKNDYRPSGTLTSSVFDAGTTVKWGTVSWNASTPPLTSIIVYTRSGTDDNPADGGWSPWAECSSGDDLPYENRYIQYRITLTTADGTTTPIFEDITINYTIAEPTCIITEPSPDWFGIFLIAVVIIAVVMGTWYWNRRRNQDLKILGNRDVPRNS